jgi:hypothetical protein
VAAGFGLAAASGEKLARWIIGGDAACGSATACTTAGAAGFAVSAGLAAGASAEASRTSAERSATVGSLR